jgi:hypothetical protein
MIMNDALGSNLYEERCSELRTTAFSGGFKESHGMFN